MFLPMRNIWSSCHPQFRYWNRKSQFGSAELSYFKSLDGMQFGYLVT